MTPVIVGIFMVELETKLVTTFGNSVQLWRRYVDDTFCIIKRGFKDNILSSLNDFHEHIKLISEDQTNTMIVFLDVINCSGTVSYTHLTLPTKA